MNKLKRFFYFLPIFCLWLTASPALALSVAKGVQESTAKAAYIIKFKKFVTWPEDTAPASAPIVIGVAGSNTVASELADQIAKRPASKRQITSVQLQPGDSLEGIHILYIGNDQTQAQITTWLSQAQGKPVLAITDAENMPPGSMINFVQEENRVRFDVSLTAAELGRIKLSAALLSVAREVYGGKK